MRVLTLALPAVLLAAGIALASGQATDPEAMKREAVMFQIGGSMKVLGEMAGGKTPYDAAAAEAAKVALVAAAADIPNAYATQGGADATSEAKAEIWTNWDDFLVKAGALKSAAEAMDVSSPETIGAGMGAAGGTCKDCHSVYRM